MQGNLKVKSKGAKERDFKKISKDQQYAGHMKVPSKGAKERDFKNLSKDQQYAGNMKVKSKGAKERDFKKQSKEEQLFAGNYKIKKNKNEDLHPSSEYRGGKVKNSYAQKERSRKRKLWWSKTKKNDDQPKHLKEKRKKPKYDPKEGDIWND